MITLGDVILSDFLLVIFRTTIKTTEYKFSK